MLAHAAYLEKLASLRDETSPEWHPTIAGLVVLRLVDSWLDLGTQVVTTDVTGLHAVRASITAILEGDPVRSILGSVVHALEQAEVATIQAVTPTLLAYGQALHYANQWRLAEDVFATIRTRAETAGQPEISRHAALQLAPILRKSGELEAAEEIYVSVIRDAQAVGDIESRLRAQNGRAKIASIRGDLPAADAMLAAILREAEEHHLNEMCALVLHDRSYLSHLRGNYSAAVKYAHQALEGTCDPVSRDRILADLAAAFLALGHVAASRDANLILASTAQEQEIRWSALINLMETAAIEHHELAFESYRTSLQDTALPPRLKAYFHFEVAKGYRLFAKPELAIAEFHAARQLAERFSLNQLLFEIDETLLEQAPRAVSHSAVPQTWPEDIAAIASTIGEQRRLYAHLP